VALRAPLDEFLDKTLAAYDRPPIVRVRLREGQTQERDYDQIIRNGAPEGDRSNLFQAVVWHLASQGHSVEQIVEELARYPNGIAAKYADRLEQEVNRSYNKWTRSNGQGGEGLSLADFRAYMPMHAYIFAPARSLWPAASVNSRIAPLPLLDANGQPVFDKKGKPKYISAAQWLDQNQPVEMMTWAPGLPELIQGRLIAEGGWIERQGVTCYNLYRPPTLRHGDPGKAGPWLDHVRLVYPNDADHCIPWLGHRVQRPEEKINHALVLGGEQGIGKDTLLEPVKAAVGPWNFHEVSPQQMLGRFNSFLKSVILRVNEARDLGEFDRYQFYNHMKAYTAAPPDTLHIDEKHLHEYYIPNCCGVVITTNHKTDGIYLPADDRRHYLAWSELTKEAFSPDYWNQLWRWYREGGIEHVAAYLAQLDLSAFDPKVPPPKTQAFFAIADANRSPEDAELADALDAIGNPEVVTLRDLIEARVGSHDFHEWLSDRKNRRIFPHRFESCGYEPVRNDTAPEDGLWKIAGKRQAVYARKELPLRDQLRAARKRTAAGGEEEEERETAVNKEGLFGRRGR
jgi:hypothetical protein